MLCAGPKAGDAFPLFLLPLVPAAFLPGMFHDTFRNGGRFVPRILLFITLGMVCGSVAVAGGRRLEPTFGVPPAEAVKVRGVLRLDPVRTSAGGALLSLTLKEAVGSGGITASASGVLPLLVSRGEDVPLSAIAGMELAVGIRRPDADAASPLFFALPGTVRLTGYGGAAVRARSAMLRFAGERFSRSPGAQPLLEALLLGRKQDPSDPLFLLFRRAGASHILALSGMHVGILAALLLLFLGPLLGRNRARTVVVALLPLYVFTVGIRPSLVRAVLFFALGQAVPWCANRALRALTVTFLVQTALFPLSPYELSFQLSYLALAGIIVFAKPAAGFFASLLFPPAAAAAAGASCAALLSTAFLSLLRFGELRPASLVSSLLLTVPVLLLVWCGVLMLLVPAAAPAAGFLSDRIIGIADLCSRLPAFRGDGPAAVAAAVAVLTCALAVRYLLPDGLPFRLRFALLHIRLSSEKRHGDAETVRPEFSHLSRGQDEDRGTARAG